MALPLKVSFQRRNDIAITVIGLQDVASGQFYTNGTVTATLVDQYKNPVPGVVAIPLTLIGGSQGNYRGIVEQAFGADPSVIPLGGGYTLQITATVPNGQGSDGIADGFWEILAEVITNH